MGRSAMELMKVDLRFWPYAVLYASYIKNRLPHDGLNGQVPLAVWSNQRIDLSGIKVFGCLAHSIPAVVGRNKFLPKTEACLFLGIAPHASYNTAILYNPVKNSLSYPHLTDVYLNEDSTYQQYLSEQQRHLDSVRHQPTDLPKLQKLYLSETDSDTDDNTGLEASDALQAPDKF